MAIKLSKAVYNFPVNTIIFDLSFELEQRLIAAGFATNNLIGGTTATHPTLLGINSSQEQTDFLLQPFATWEAGSGGIFTVATLPAASAGSRAFVSDATVTTFSTVVAGGGANGVPVFNDGTNWRIG